MKAHHEREGNRYAPTKKLDGNYLNVSGVSPIRCRHEIDLYGTKDGTGKFNPIMVQNLHSRAGHELFQTLNEKVNQTPTKSDKKNGDPKSAGKSGAKDQKSTSSKPAPIVKSAKLNKNQQKDEKKGATLKLTNQDKKRKDLDSKFNIPATFDSQYSVY